MKAVLVCLGALAASFISATAASQQAARYFPMAPVNGQSLPFSEAVQVGNTLYLSGQIGTAPGTLELISGGTLAQARQVMENIKAILERRGSSMDHVVKCTVFLTDMKEWPAFNDVYRKYFKTHLPARSALGANGLALGASVEVECIAVVP